MGKFLGEILRRTTIIYSLQDKKFIKNNQQVNLVCCFYIHYFLITNMRPGNHGCNNNFPYFYVSVFVVYMCILSYSNQAWLYGDAILCNYWKMKLLNIYRKGQT